MFAVTPSFELRIVKKVYLTPSVFKFVKEGRSQNNDMKMTRIIISVSISASMFFLVSGCTQIISQSKESKTAYNQPERKQVVDVKGDRAAEAVVREYFQLALGGHIRQLKKLVHIESRKRTKNETSDVGDPRDIQDILVNITREDLESGFPKTIHRSRLYVFATETELKGVGVALVKTTLKSEIDLKMVYTIIVRLKKRNSEWRITDYEPESLVESPE